MNGWQGMLPYARNPEYNLGDMARSLPQSQAQPVPAQPSPQGQGNLIPMASLAQQGGGVSPSGMQAPLPQEQPQAQAYDSSTTKKIMGMPKDRFIALMGSIAQAFGGDSASGRMGANLINMAEMMRSERVGQAEGRAGAAETKRKEAREDAKERRKATATRKGKAPAVRTFRVGDMDVQHSYDSDTGKWEPIPGMLGKKVEEKEGKAPTIRTFRVGDMDVQHKYDFAAKKWEPIPGMPGKKVKPPAGEKPKEMTYAEKRARVKAAKDSEAKILNPEYQTPEYQDGLQMEIDNFARYSDKPYTYLLTPGTPGKETGYFDFERDVEPVMPTIEKVDISSPEKIMESNLPDDRKRRLLLQRFPAKFK